MIHWKTLSLDSLTEVHEEIFYVEEWKAIRGYEGLYEVSTFGRIKALPTNRRELHIKAQSLANGYPVISLYKNGKEKKAQVHRLVALEFIPNPQKKQTVNHRKAIRIDNRVHQLEWATQSENNKHAYREGLRQPPLTGRSGGLSATSKKINQIDISTGNVIKQWDSITEAQKASAGKPDISGCLRGILRTSNGYKWEYV